MSTTQEQLAFLRTTMNSSALPSISVETTQTESQHVEQDDLLQKIFDLGLFDAVVPEPQDGERIFEYEDRRKVFNLILHDFLSEQLNAVNEEHAEEIAELESRLSAAEEGREKEMNRAADLQYSLDKLQDDYEELKESYNKSKEERKYEAPSESIKTRIAGLKELSADDMVKRFQERQAAKSTLPQVEDLQFRTEADSSQFGNYPVPASIEIPEVAFPFQARSEEVSVNSDGGEVVSQAIRDYVENRLERFAKEFKPTW